MMKRQHIICPLGVPAILSLAFLFAVVSCKKEDVEYARFSNYSFPGLYNLVTNSYVNNNKISFSTYEGLFCFDNLSIPGKEWNMLYSVYHEPSFLHKMPISSDYFVTIANDSTLVFRSAGLQSHEYTLNVSQLDTAFIRFELIPYDMGITAEINDNGYFAITYLQRNVNTPPYMTAVQMVLLICKPVLGPGTENNITIENIEYTRAPLGYTGDLTAIGTYKNDFFVSFTYGLNRVSQNGQVIDLAEGEERMNFINFNEFFTFNESLYCLNNSQVRKFDETDRLWISQLHLENVMWYINKHSQFVQIDGYLIAYGDKIAIISDFESNKPSYSSKNINLKNITSVNAFGDYVYVTTFNGVYYMKRSEFFKNK